MTTVWPMKNLWMKSTPVSEPSFIHTLRLFAEDFAPTWKAGQDVDAESLSGVIPLRRVSYQLLAVLI
jgi:hypothetical protein